MHCRWNITRIKAVLGVRNTNAQTQYNYESFLRHAEQCNSCNQKLDKLLDEENQNDNKPKAVKPKF